MDLKKHPAAAAVDRAMEEGQLWQRRLENKRRSNSNNSNNSSSNSSEQKVDHALADLSLQQQEKELCVVCLHSAKSLAFVPCGHLCACTACGKKLKECPLCRAPVQQWLRVYQ